MLLTLPPSLTRQRSWPVATSTRRTWFQRPPRASSLPSGKLSREKTSPGSRRRCLPVPVGGGQPLAAVAEGHGVQVSLRPAPDGGQLRVGEIDGAEALALGHVVEVDAALLPRAERFVAAAD